MQNNETFKIKAYGKSELAMMYFPECTKESAIKRLKRWFSINPRLQRLLKVKGKSYTPKHVQLIVNEVGEPY